MKTICPHCGTIIAVQVEITDVTEFTDAPTEPNWWKVGLTTEQLQIVENARAKGMLDALQSIIKQMPNTRPKSIERFLISVLKTSVVKRIPEFALNIFIAEFGGLISFYSAQGVGIVASDGIIRMFCPISLVAGASLRGFGVGGAKRRLSAEAGPLRDWLRTRSGYVPISSPMFIDELHRRSIGDFALPEVNRKMGG